MDNCITVVIRDLTIWGEGVGTHEGLTLFVDGALPGEKVRASIYERKPTYAKAKLEEIIEPSKHRVQPICPVFGKCGGCQIMHLSYNEQLKIKRKRVVDAFERIGKLKEFTVHECVASKKPLYYRNKMQLPINKDLKVGLYAKRSHDIVPIETCYIQSESGDKILQGLKFVKEIRHILIRTNRKGESLIVLVTREAPSAAIKQLAKTIFEKKGVKGVLHGLNAREDNVLFSDAYTRLFGEDQIEEEVLGIKVDISPASFFQVNVWQAENLYEKAFGLAELKQSERVLDAYSGIGVFSIYLAKQGIDVVGIEIVSAAVKDARKNAEENGVYVDFRLGNVEDVIENVQDFEVVFLNPPRKGCEVSVLQATLKKNPKKIIYTSCDPATLARDLQVLAEGGYTKVEAFPFDMFPQTMHVETVVRVEKGDSQ